MASQYPKLRRDLIVRTQTEREQTIYTIKDPVTDRFFRLRAPEYYLLSRADGHTSPAEAARKTGERFGVLIPEQTAAAFYDKMERLLFFEGPGIERVASSSGQRRNRSIWMWPLKAFDPDRALTRWLGRLRLLFHPLAVVGSLIVMVAAVGVAFSQTALWGQTILDLWRLTSIPLLFVAIFVLAGIHETGHALTLKYFGGSVREMGFLLLYLQPCFYCNISDTYLIDSRRRRIFVGLAGLFFQGLATAVAIFLWRVIEPGNIVSDFLWVFTAVSLALFLFNLNPLIKLDGYYILVDWLDIPNLRAKALAYWRRTAARWLWGADRPEPVVSPRVIRIYRWYGLAAMAYTFALLGWLLYHIARFLYSRWGLAGDILFFGALVALAITTRSRARTMTEQETSEKQAETVRSRRRRPLIVWGTIAIVLILSAVIPLERRVGSECEVDAGSRFTVTWVDGGTLESELLLGGLKETRSRSLIQAQAADFSVIAYDLRVREGAAVRRGDTLVALSSNRYKAELMSRSAERDKIVAERNLLLSGPKKDEVVQIRAQIAEIEALEENKRLELERGKQSLKRHLISQEELEAKQAEYEMAIARKDAKKSELAILISEPKAEELAIKDAQIAGLDAEIAFLTEQMTASTILSPLEGVVTRVERGGTLVETADCDPVRVMLMVDEDDIADVTTDASVTLKVRAHPYRKFFGRVSHIAGDADSLASGQRFVVTTEIENPESLLRPGMTGYAKIACGKRPILSLAARRMIQFFRVEFWSWW